MAVVTKSFEVETTHENQMVDITDKVRKAVGKVSEGLVTVFVTHSTAAIIVIENEAGLIKDFPAMLDRVAPKDAKYEHHRTAEDENGRSHVKASMLGPSVSIPVTKGELVLGVWQQVVLLELDIRPRKRTVVVTAVGE